VILEASPYHGTLYDRAGGRMIPVPGNDGKHTGLSGFLPPRGYAVVFMDMPGTGLSSGCLSSFGTSDQPDLRDVIERAASARRGRLARVAALVRRSTPRGIGRRRGANADAPHVGRAVA
jgi:hypothetical protein